MLIVSGLSQGLYLVDGYSIIYRGYFAFLNRPLLNPQGRNSSSVFVFFRTLLQIVRERAPGYLAVAMDSRVPTFRHVRYEQYKATREKAPADLHAQVPVIEEILEALGVPCIRKDGFEADDVIATLAEGCRATGRPCWILSGDKDILQLIGGNVRLLAQERRATDFAEYSREKVFESRGVYPEQIVDYLALVGDSSDNVPGVRGIGEKTAEKLLADFGSLDAIYEKLEEVTPETLRKKLESGREAAFLSRELVTLKRDIPGLPCAGRAGAEGTECVRRHPPLRAGRNEEHRRGPAPARGPGRSSGKGESGEGKRAAAAGRLPPSHRPLPAHTGP